MYDAFGLVLLGFLIVLLYFGLIGILIASYILSSYSIHQIGKKNNIKNSWLAWIPVAGNWILGSIVDKCDIKTNYDRNWKKILLILGIVFYGGFIISYIWLISVAFAVGISSSYGYSPDAASVFALIIPYIFLIAAAVCGTGFQICQSICIYKLFENLAPEKAVKYILLYVMVPLAGPICLFKCNKRLGFQSQIVEDNNVL